MAEASLQGKLLISNPRFTDFNFDRTVVLVVSHGTEGAAGVILNRPSPVALIDPMPEWERLATHPGVLFQGGPVGTDMALCVASAVTSAPETGTWQHIDGRLGLISLEADPDLIGGSIDQLRVFQGYAGWEAEQLEQELVTESWFVVESDPSDVFSDRPESLWQRVLRRQGGNLAIVAAFPSDLSAN